MTVISGMHSITSVGDTLAVSWSASNNADNMTCALKSLLLVFVPEVLEAWNVLPS